MAKPPSYFLLHFFNPHRVGIIIVCDFFRLKSATAPERAICIELQRVDRGATLLLKKIERIFKTFYAFFIPLCITSLILWENYSRKNIF